MKIAISASTPDLSSPVDPRFGRAPYFIIYDLETGVFDALPNPGAQAAQGAGPEAVRFLMERGVNLVITGEVGPNAQMALQRAGIQTILGFSGTVQDAINAVKSGNISPIPPGGSPPPGFGGPGGGFGGPVGGFGRGRRGWGGGRGWGGPGRGKGYGGKKGGGRGFWG